MNVIRKLEHFIMLFETTNFNLIKTPLLKASSTKRTLKINQICKRYLMSRYHFVKYSIGAVTQKQVFISPIRQHNSLPTNKPYVFSKFNYCTIKDKLPMCLPQRSLLNILFRKFLKLAFIWVLFIRSFFLTPRSFYISLILITFISSSIAPLSHFFPTLNQFTAVYFQVYIGIQLLVYDDLASRISSHLLTDPDPILCLTSLTTLSNSTNLIKRKVSVKAIGSLFIGKTPMTATGRAALVGAAFTGGTWLYNERLNRRAMDQRAQADRTATDIRTKADRDAANKRAQADRDAAADNYKKTCEFEAWKIRYNTWVQDHRAWRSSMFKKGPEPKEPIYDACNI